MKTDNRLIVIGGGIAGVSAAQAARHEYPQAGITLLAAEPYPFYNKIALSTYIAGKGRLSHLFFYQLNWLQAQRIQPQWGVAVESIDAAGHAVELADGERLPYDKLIIATGAQPVRPPIEGIDSPRVFTLWSLEDAVRLRPTLEQARSVHIIGAGVLGVETAVELTSAGIDVTLVDLEDSVLPLHLDDESSLQYRRFLAKKGIEVRLKTRIVSIYSDSKGANLVAADGSHHTADAVLLMTGVFPDVALARAAGLVCNRGICVDDYLVTSDPDIRACGNCVEHQGELNLLWNSARTQGEIAGVNAFEEKLVFVPTLPAIHVKTREMPLFVCGRNPAREDRDQVIIDRRSDSYRLIVLNAERRIRYVIFLGNTDSAYELEKAIKQSRPIPEAATDVERIVESFSPNVSLGEYPGRKWVCRMCGYTYEGDHPPESCPVCSVGRDQFLAA